MILTKFGFHWSNTFRGLVLSEEKIFEKVYDVRRTPSDGNSWVRWANNGNAKRGVSPHLKIRPCDLDLWPWKSIGSRFSYGLSNLDKIHWRMLILQCSQGCYAVKIWPGDVNLWPMTLKINRVPDFGQNPLKDLDSRVFTRMLRKDGQTERRKEGWTVALLFPFTTSLVRV